MPGAKWEKIICKQGDVRITHPMVPHGSTGPATAKRLTMLPWLVLERGRVMEIPAMGSYNDISKAHRDHTVPPCTPSGYPNKYGGINWAFPADVHIDFKSNIQKALLAQVKWSNPLVEEEVSQLLNSSKEDIDRAIADNRAHVIEQIKLLWPKVKTLEKAAFAANPSINQPDCSFFTNKGVHPTREGEWTNWDHDVGFNNALDRLIVECGLESDEREWFLHKTNAATVPTPISPHQRVRSGSGSLNVADGGVAIPRAPPVPPIPNPLPTPISFTPAAGPSQPRRSERNKKPPGSS